ncbi:MAG: hypothetical protein V1753_04395 [Pseudomonadota bacterium]
MPNSYLNNNGNVSQESTDQVKLTEASKMPEEQFRLEDVFGGATLPLQQDLPINIKKQGRRIGFVDDFATELIPNVPPLGTKLAVLSNYRASAPLLIFEKHSFFDKISQIVNKKLLYATIAGLMVVSGTVGVYFFWKSSTKSTNIIEPATSPDLVLPAAPEAIKVASGPVSLNGAIDRSISSSGRVSLHISQLSQGLNYTSGTSMPLAIGTASETSN